MNMAVEIGYVVRVWQRRARPKESAVQISQDNLKLDTWDLFDVVLPTYIAVNVDFENGWEAGGRHNYSRTLS